MFDNSKSLTIVNVHDVVAQYQLSFHELLCCSFGHFYFFTIDVVYSGFIFLVLVESICIFNELIAHKEHVHFQRL
jgi:hypothetical protein